MKRSDINRCIRDMEKLIRENGFHLPPFCNWTPEEWESKGHEYDEIRDNMLGWDITDYGLGDWNKVGFALITLRNGNQKDPKYKKVYAEKLLMLKEGQHSPMHFHWTKSEDIINRGGGTLIIHIYNADENEELADTDVCVNSDGRSYYVPAGTGVELKPGESITLWPYQYHDFDVKPGTGDVLIGEVSMCNDDNTDNRFNPPVGRFPEIEEDEEPYRLLCNEYPKAPTVYETITGDVGQPYCVKEDEAPYRAERRYTVDDYLEIPEDTRAELMDGVLYDMASPGISHQDICTRLTVIFGSYINRKKGKCKVFAGPVDVQLDCDDDTMVVPDLTVVCDDSKIEKGRIMGAPDLVVEIVSPSSRRRDYVIKTEKYCSAGVREYWIIDPDNERVLVYCFEKDDVPVMYVKGEIVPAGIFEGDLKIRVSEIFG